MARIMFPSLTYGDSTGYLLDSRYNSNHWRMYDSNFIHPHAKHFETYGDGFVQHSPETPIPIKYFGDWCASLAIFIQSEAEAGRRDAVQLLAEIWPTRHNEAFDAGRIIKASKIKHKPYQEGMKNWRQQYVNGDDLTVSTAEGKRHDKRWEELYPLADGSIPGIFYLLKLKRNCTLSGLEVYMRYNRIVEVMNDVEGDKGYPVTHYFDKVVNEPDGWRQWDVRDAFNALEYAVKAETNRDYAARAATGLQSNIDYQMEKRAKAAGLVELTEEVANP